MSHYPEKSEAKEPRASIGKFLTQFQRQLLHKSLLHDLPERYRQRIEIMLLADEGKTQTEICQSLGCCPATVRHWMHIARTGMAHQWRDCPIGRPKAVSDEYLERLEELVSCNPRDYGYPFRRWTVNWLAKHLAKELGVEVSDRHIKRLLKEKGLSTVPKPEKTSEDAGKKTLGGKILITDLKSKNIPNESEFLVLNFSKLDKDLDIHGAKSIRAASFLATTQQYFGSLSRIRGIPALS